MKLKHYQSDTLAVLRRFFEDARTAGPKNAYETIVNKPEYADRLGRYGGRYTTPLEDLPNVPYVCLRLPTGGGKTILGAHAVRIARDAWVERDYPLVLWLVPTNTIRLQTAEALKHTRHAYRRVLDDAFDGRVRVFDIADFTLIRPHDLRDHCCIVVGTIQTLRVTNTEGRKVYAHNENLEPHFSTFPTTLPGLDKLNNGGVKFSFANLMHGHRPLMIVDEAHNAVTGLTRDVQTRVNPCAIIEFTATPGPKSNVLYGVTAQELKREEMIKLPIMLSEHDTWQNAVSGAVAARAALAKAARGETGYVRPIVLFQAQKKNQEVTVEVLKKHLLEVEHVPAHALAVATGDQRELDAIDLFDPECPIEYVITVEALKEGWDCSFAYVFCSVSRMQSAQNVEQLFGRVLRMPYAKRRRAAELNKAYAYVSEPAFGEAARALTDKLVNMGFEEEEARENVRQHSLGFGEGDLFHPPEQPKPTFSYTLALPPEIPCTLNELERTGLAVRETNGGEVEITITGNVDVGLEEAILATVPEVERPALAKAVKEYRTTVEQSLSPAERGKRFNVPRLTCEIQGTMEFADTDRFVEDHDWSLLYYPAKLDEDEFMVRETARSFEIDIDGKRVTHQFVNEWEQHALNVAVEGWTPEALTLWMDRQVRGPDLRQDELLKWLRDLVGHMIHVRKIHVFALTRCKFSLARKIANKLNAIRRQERERAYQQCLLAPAANVEISFDVAVAFKDGMYGNERRYGGRWKPTRHFLGPDNVPAFDGAIDGEEVQCAQALDGLPDVKYWIRNVARHPESFWLPTATDRFYPDFVALLNDERVLIVEYKGAHIAEGSDTTEKRTIGALWEQRSHGRGLFIIVEKNADGKDVRRQLMEKNRNGLSGDAHGDSGVAGRGNAQRILIAAIPRPTRPP